VRAVLGIKFLLIFVFESQEVIRNFRFSGSVLVDYITRKLVWSFIDQPVGFVLKVRVEKKKSSKQIVK